MTDAELVQQQAAPLGGRRSARRWGLVVLVRDLPIGRKLALGFGVLTLLTLVVVALSVGAGAEAATKIQTADDVRLQSATAAWKAQADLLRMLGDVRGYLFLGDPAIISSYEAADAEFRDELDQLRALAPLLSPADQQRIGALAADYERWIAYPEQLFALRDDQMEREPAYFLLNTTGTDLAGGVLIATASLIEAVAAGEPTAGNNALLADLSEFQSSFAAMFSGLRGYVTTRNAIFRYYEYEVNLSLNDEVWSRILERRPTLDPEVAALVDTIAAQRAAFLAQIPDQTYAQMTSPGWRRDLQLFSDEVVPLTDAMQRQLRELTLSQQAALTTDLGEGNQSLQASRVRTLAGGVLAVLLGLFFAVTIARGITLPVRKLTQVAERISAGDLVIRAPVESNDEVGLLAATFNKMTRQLRYEKKRVDDLLDVVIPIGVALAQEKNYDRLLDTILAEAKKYAAASAGSLYLRTADDQLRHVIVRDDVRGIAMGGVGGAPVTLPTVPLCDEHGDPRLRVPAVYAAIRNQTVCLADVASQAEFDTDDAAIFGTASAVAALLAIPLANSQGQVIGVLKLCNAPCADAALNVAFDANLQRMMESLSSLAVTALESYRREQELRREIQQLKIEIDEAKRARQVSEIVETDFFQGLQQRARTMRTRGRGEPGDA